MVRIKCQSAWYPTYREFADQQAEAYKARYWWKIAIFHTPAAFNAPPPLRPIYSDATQLNSTSSWVEFRRYRHPHRRNSTVADDRQCNWPSWTAYSQSARSRSVVFLFLLFLHGRWRLWLICHINRHVFSINFSSNSSLQNSISRQTRQNTSYMTSWPTNWVKWVTTLRTDRWQLFTLWTCRQLNVELGWVVFL